MIMQADLNDEKIFKPAAPLIFKVASEDWEFEQIHSLNYETFVEEIPQRSRPVKWCKSASSC